MPKLAESVVEGEIVQWLVNEGDPVKVDQPLVEVMSDKATVELSSTVTGVLSKQLAAEGEIRAVGDVLALIEAEGTSAVADVAGTAVSEPDANEAEADGSEESDDSTNLFRPTAAKDSGPAFQVQRRDGALTAPAAPARAVGPFGRVLAVPAARRRARELGIDIEQLAGSGPGGRVRLDDVEAGARTAAGSGLPEPVQYRTPAGYEQRETREKLRGIRRLTSQQMVASHLHTVRALHVDEAEVSALVQLRRKLKPLVESQGAKLSYLPLIMKAVVASLKRYPVLNTSLDEAAQEIAHKDYWNISMAVSTERGLLVPVIFDVDQLDLTGLSQQISDKAERARDGKLKPEELSGGSFAVTNIGSVGGQVGRASCREGV